MLLRLMWPLTRSTRKRATILLGPRCPRRASVAHGFLGDAGANDAQNRAGMGKLLAPLLCVITNSVGAGRHPVLDTVLVALGGACCPTGGKGAGSMVWQIIAVEGRLVATFAATVEHLERNDQPPQSRPQASGQEVVPRSHTSRRSCHGNAMRRTATRGRNSKRVSSLHLCWGDKTDPGAGRATHRN